MDRIQLKNFLVQPDTTTGYRTYNIDLKKFFQTSKVQGFYYPLSEKIKFGVTVNKIGQMNHFYVDAIN